MINAGQVIMGMSIPYFLKQKPWVTIVSPVFRMSWYMSIGRYISIHC